MPATMPVDTLGVYIFNANIWIMNLYANIIEKIEIFAEHDSGEKWNLPNTIVK